MADKFEVCAQAIEEVFGIKVKGSKTPREHFVLALVTAKKHKSVAADRELKEFSKHEQRLLFQRVAIPILIKSREKEKRLSLTREKFIRRVVKHMEREGLRKVERLLKSARSGVYKELNRNFAWLLKNFREAIKADGSNPGAKIVFDGSRWKPSAVTDLLEVQSQ